MTTQLSELSDEEKEILFKRVMERFETEEENSLVESEAVKHKCTKIGVAETHNTGDPPPTPDKPCTQDAILPFDHCHEHMTEDEHNVFNAADYEKKHGNAGYKSTTPYFDHRKNYYDKYKIQ